MLPPTVARAAASCLFGASLVAGLAGAARAATPPIDAATATAIQAQVRAVIAGAIGIDPAPVGLTVSPEGDHYAMQAALPPTFTTPGGKPVAPLTATLRPADGGAWLVQQMMLPSPVQTTITLPSTKPNAGPRRIEVLASIDHQDNSGRIDPTLATPSSFGLMLQGLTVAQQDPERGTSSSHAGKTVERITATPVAEGRVDLVQTGTTDNVAYEQTPPGKKTLITRMDHLSIDARANRVDLARVGPVLNHLIAAIRLSDTVAAAIAGRTPSVPPKPSAAQRAELRKVVESLRDISSGITLAEAVDGLKIGQVDGPPVELRHADLGVGLAAQGPDLGISIELGMAGLIVPRLSEAARGLVPKQVAVRMTAGGFDLAGLNRVLLDATANLPVPAIAGDIRGLFGANGLSAGIDAMRFDIGDAVFEGTAAVTAARPDQDAVNGHAHITATGFDALLTQVQSTPELARGVAVLGLIRGFARPDPTAPAGSNRLVWDIVFSPGTFTVNGIDMSALAGGNGGKRGVRPPSGRTPD